MVIYNKFKQNQNIDLLLILRILFGPGVHGFQPYPKRETDRQRKKHFYQNLWKSSFQTKLLKLSYFVVKRVCTIFVRLKVYIWTRPWWNSSLKKSLLQITRFLRMSKTISFDLLQMEPDVCKQWKNIYILYQAYWPPARASHAATVPRSPFWWAHRFTCKRRLA